MFAFACVKYIQIMEVHSLHHVCDKYPLISDTCYSLHVILCKKKIQNDTYGIVSLRTPRSCHHSRPLGRRRQI